MDQDQEQEQEQERELERELERDRELEREQELEQEQEQELELMKTTGLDLKKMWIRSVFLNGTSEATATATDMVENNLRRVAENKE